MKIFLSTVFLTLLVACNVPQEVSSEIQNITFPKNKVLIGLELQIPPVLLKPDKAIIVDNYLIVFQDRSDSIFSLFKLPNCEPVLFFGTKGKGPHEFNSHRSSSFKRFHSEKEGFAICNLRTHLQYYNIEDVLKGNLKPSKVEIVIPTIAHFRSITYVGDTSMIVAPYSTGQHICEYNFMTHELNELIEYPTVYPLMHRQILRDVYACYTTTKPDNKRVAISYGNEGRIEIIDLQTKRVQEIRYKDFPSLEKNLGLNKSSIGPTWGQEKIFSWDIKSTDQYIYCKVFNSKRENVADSKGYTTEVIPEVHVFDWYGTSVAKLKFDKFFNEFAVDSQDGFLYTVDERFEDIIRRYNISNSLSKD